MPTCILITYGWLGSWRGFNSAALGASRRGSLFAFALTTRAPWRSVRPALQRADCFLLLVPSPTKWGLPLMFRGLTARRLALDLVSFGAATPPRCHPVPHGLALWIAQQSGHLHAVGGALLKFRRGVHRASSQSFP